MKRLAIITTHPIQYYAPIFRLLHERGQISVKVFYTWGEAALEKYDPGFKRTISWDVPLLEGYAYDWAENIATDPGSHHFKGIITPTLNEQIAQWKPDAVLIFGWAYEGHLAAMRYFKGIVPVFFRGDSTLLDAGSGIKQVLRRIFLRRIYNKVDRAFYVGTNNRMYYKACGLHDGQLTFTPHAIANDEFAADHSKEAQRLRTDLNLLPDDILVLFAGKFEAKKDPLLLLEAFKQLKNVETHLLFVGNGELEQALKRAAKGDKRIHFMDFQNQSAMPSVYQAADVFCLPSAGPGETWGLAVNEAMAAGKAIIVSDKVGCAVDLVKNDINGQVFKNRSVKHLAAALQKLTADKRILVRMGQESAKMIQPWNFTAIAEAIETQLTAQ